MRNYTINAQSCTYCGIANPKCLIQCDVCDRRFCNGRGNTNESHAIIHLIKANHKEVSLPKNSLHNWGNRMECCNCKSRNIFNLGFIPNKWVILCRAPCAFKGNLNGCSWDPEQWHPFIEDRVFVAVLVGEPSWEESRLARTITIQQITRIEKESKEERDEFPIYNREEVRQKQQNTSKFNNGYEYGEFFEPLVEMEAEYQTKIKHNIQIRWDIRGREVMAFFEMDKPDIEYNEDVKLSYFGEGRHWSGWGSVKQIPDDRSNEVGILMIDGTGIPIQYTSNFVVECAWETVSFDRVVTAIHKFSKNGSSKSVSPILYDILLGNKIEPVTIKSSLTRLPNTDCEFRTQKRRRRPKNIYKYSNSGSIVSMEEPEIVSIPEVVSVPNLPDLNPSQLDAVRHSIRRVFSLIQGPPGTGKTVTSTAIVYNLVQSISKPVLVCAPSNVAVDHLTKKLDDTGLIVVRVYAKIRENGKPTSVSHLSLHIRARDQNEELKRLQKLKEKGFLSSDDEERYRSLKRSSEMSILKGADVICCTCNAAGDRRLQEFRFHSVLIDESTQTIEPECLVPIVLGTEQLILVGDHKQLGPVVKCQQAEREGLHLSLFKRMVNKGIIPLCLEIQYRMHPCLSEFPSIEFYEGRLRDGISANDRKMEELAALWPKPDKPMFFYCCEDLEEFAGSGTSFLNRMEAKIVEQILTYLVEHGIKGQQIGVITPYDGQRQYLEHYLKYKSKNCSKADHYPNIQVASVNSFQGLEKDLIIFSCVRSNERHGIGFLKDPGRLNVAITRARYGLIVVGNPTVLSKNALWKRLITVYEDNEVLVDGPLDNLTPRLIQISDGNVPKK